MLYFLGLILFISSTLFWVSMVSPKTGLFWLKGTRTRIKAALIYIGINFVAVIGVLFSLASSNLDRVGSPPSASTDAIGHDDSTSQESGESLSANYVVLGEEHNQTVDNYNLLAQPEGLTKEQLQALAGRARSELCQGQCNINLWDDFRAYDLDKKMRAEEEEASRQLTDQEITLDEYKAERERIAQTHYVKIADHLVAWLPFEMETISYYPFQDDRYKELGGENYKK